jgi:NTP pyrophosphatase (non-canonical NTP hydrolase)
MTKEQFEYISKWQEERLPGISILKQSDKIREEIYELKDAISNGKFQTRFELADVLIATFILGKLMGLNYEDICASINEKMAINHNRTWLQTDGIYNHEDF